MLFKFTIVCVILNLVYADICYTPDGDIGECVPLFNCANLFHLYDPEVENKLVTDSFCEKGKETSLMVCCSVTEMEIQLIVDEKDRQLQEIVLVSTSLKNSEDCGIQSRQSSNNTGRLVSLGEFPWLVYIVTQNETEDGSLENSVACTGTLINSRYALSSAQCLVNAGGATTTFFVAIEELPAQNRTDDEPESCNNGDCNEFHYYDLDKILIHPSFNELSNLHDIALLKLNASISFTDHIRPACLPLPEIKTAKPGDILYTAGYTTWSSKVKITSTLISNAGCKAILKRRGISKSITGHEMCGVESEDDPCDDENAGKPVLFFDNERWYLDGIYSWSENCSHNYPKVYTNVSSYLQWIEVNIRDAFKNDECTSCTADVPVILQNSKNCGYQRQEKYNTTDGPISPDEFPWMTYILARTVNATSESDDESVIACTGSLITSRYVLSGAQCLVDDIDPSTEFNVAIEEFHVQDTTNCTEFAPSYDSNCSIWSYYELNDIVIHPSYNRWTYENDIALLRLNGIVTFTGYIRPLCLPLPGFKRAGSGDTLKTSSHIDWGLKTKASIRLVPNEDCKLRIKQMNDTELVHQHEICAVKSKNAVKITCDHYVGGPVMYSNNNRWHLEAIHSRSGGCTNRVPTIYTRVADYLPWIQANIKDDRCTTPNGNVGECIPLHICPELLRSFANPKKGREEYLRKFTCENGTKSDFMVCCPRIMNIFTFQNEEVELKTPETDFTAELANFENCGLHRQSTYEQKDGIIPADEFPWLANIISYTLLEDDADYSFYTTRCTGTLISARYIVATAQCLTEDVSSISAFVFYARIVEYSEGNTENCTELSPFYEHNCTKFHDFDVEETVIHPFYNQWTNLNNIALLRLNRAVPFTGYIRPICLRLLGTEAIHSREMLSTAGYVDWTVKSKAALKLISNRQCSRIFKLRNEVSPITEYEICTMKSKSATEVTCDYQIGSPVMSFSSNRWYLEGIHSKSDTCTNRVPTVYTRVYNYLQWIQDHTRPENCTTPHGEPGECKYLKDCPQLLDAFTNPEKRSDGKLDAYLRSFECALTPEPDRVSGHVLTVCCGVLPNFTIRQVPDYKNLEKKNAFEFNNSQYCGLQHKDDYYSTSDDISIDEFPWSAAIYLYESYYATQKKRIVCAGTLISRRYVLTAATCAANAFEWDMLRVRLGEYKVGNTTDCVEIPEIESQDCATAQEYDVYKPTIHTFYDQFSGLNDIALLRLKKEAELNDYVRPICLPSPKLTYVKPGDTLYTTGWGESTTREDLRVDEVELKKKIWTTIITNEECTKIRQNIYSYADAVTVNQFCTRDYRNATEFLCTADAGSPIMTRYKHKWYVIGISSKNACKTDVPHIHINVTMYLGWIYRTVEFD